MNTLTDASLAYSDLMARRMGTLLRACVLTIVLLMSTMSAVAQVTDYSVTKLSATYTELGPGASATSLGLFADDALSDFFPLGFDFFYNDKFVSEARVNSNGVVFLGTTGGSSVTVNDFNGNAAGLNDYLAPLWDDLQCTNGVRYQTTGAVGQRVCTIEFADMEWNYLSTTPMISFQAKIYESDGVIEFVYRPESTGPNNPSASVGIGGVSSDDYISISSIFPGVELVFSLGQVSYNTINNLPEEGLMFRFEPSNEACDTPPLNGFITPQLEQCGTTPIVLEATSVSVGVSFTYQWEQSPNGVDSWIDVVGGSGAETPIYTAPLLSETTYYRLRTSCGGIVNSLSPVVTAAIGEPAIDQYFNAGRIIENCWTPDPDDLLFTSYGAFSNGIGPDGGLRYNFYGAPSGTEFSYTSPILDPLDAGSILTFDVAGRRYSATSIDTIYLEESANGGLDWTINQVMTTELGDVLSTSPGPFGFSIYRPEVSDWVNLQYPLAENTNRVRFRAVSDFGHYLYMDNITLLNQSCPPVEGLAIGAISPTSVQISWDALPEATTYDWEIYSSVDTPGLVSPVASGSGTDTAYLAAGIFEDNTDYTLYVTAECGAEAGRPSTYSFFNLVIPDNDDCAQAIDITCGEVVSGNTDYATPETVGVFTGINEEANSLWYRFVGVNSSDPSAAVGTPGDLTIFSMCNDNGATDGSAGYDSKIDVYRGNCGVLVHIGGNDDGGGCNSLSSIFQFSSTVGTEYFVRVYGYTGFSDGEFSLSVDCAEQCESLPTNDFCSAAQTLTVNPFDSPMPTAGTTECASSETFNPSCDLFGEVLGVWYTFTTDETGEAYLDVTRDTALDVSAVVYTTSPCDGETDELICVSPFGDQDIFYQFLPTLPLTTYKLLVYSESNTAGSFSVNVRTADPNVIPNDLCQQSTPLQCGEVYSGSTTGATSQVIGSFTGTNELAPSVWYQFTGADLEDPDAPNGAAGDQVTLSVCNDAGDTPGSAAFDSKIDVYAGSSCSLLTHLGGNDDNSECTDFSAKYTFNTRVGQEYRVRVYGFDADAFGPFALSMECAPACPADINVDGTVDVADFIAFNSAFGNSCTLCPSDLNADGQVDVQDFLIFNSAFNTDCAQLLTTVDGPDGLPALSPLLSEVIDDMEARGEEVDTALLKLISEMREEISLTVYPNPGDGQGLMIDIARVSTQAQSSADIQVYDISGQLLHADRRVLDGRESSIQLQFADRLSAGMYLLHLRVDGELIVERIVVE